MFSGVSMLFFNAAVLTGTDLTAEELRAKSTRAGEFAAGMSCPWILIVTESAVAAGTDIPATLDAAGFAPLIPLTGMVAKSVAPPHRVPEELVISAPGDDTGCTALLDVNSSAYGMCFDAGQAIWGTMDFWKHHSASLGSLDGKPVARPR